MALYEQEARFSHLLNPIRDLTKNWNVDIAFYLEEYLNELENISISFDDGKTTMNFVQAALLIQGSACVYGKKVDFLYNLVLQLLDLLKTNKKDRQPNDNRAKDGAREACGQFDEFVPLDITPSDNIDLKEENDVPVKMIPRNYFHRLKTDKNEKGDFPILNIKDDLVGNKNDFGIHFNRIHRSGTSLQNLTMYSELCIAKDGQSLINLAVQISSSQVNDNHNIGDGDASQKQTAIEADVAACDDFMSNDDDGGDPFLDVDDGDMPSSPNGSIAENVGEATKKKELAAENALRDWQPLNPQDAVPSKIKIARKGKTCNPKKTTKPSKKKLKKDSNAETLKEISDFCNDAFFSQASKLPKEPHKQPSYSFLDQAFYEEMKRRKLERQKLTLDKDGGESDDDEYNSGDIGGEIMDNGNLSDNNEQPDMEIRMSDEQFDELQGSLNTTNYEQLIDQYKGGVFEPYERLTGMAKKVKEWEDSLTGVLEDEENHSSFDIRTYCTKIIENFSEDQTKQKETINFLQVIKGETSSEIARYFLATLQLANNSNIDISHEDGKLDASGVHLTLLSRRQHYQEIEEFQT